jgi:hypothetical protein
VTEEQSAADLQQARPLTVRQHVAALAKIMNVSERMIYLAMQLQRSGRADLIAAVERGTLSLHAAIAKLEPMKPKLDGYTKLVKAWNAASEEERMRLLDAIARDD